MRIALVANHLGVGGAERQAALWAEACLTIGHEPVVAVLDPLSHEYDVPDSVEVVHVGKSGATDLPRVARRVREIARDSDLLVAFQSYPALCCALARSDRPWIVVAGNDPRRWRDTSRFPASVFRWAFGRAALGSAPTHGIATCHKQLGARPRNGWLVVPNIVDRRAFVAVDGSKRDALFVGRLEAVKNPQLAVEAAAAAGAPLTIAGEGSLEESLEEWLRERGEGTEVSLRGFVERPWDLYASHRVLLVTSRYESFGNMIVESLAAGTPVVSVDCDFGPSELIAGARYSHLSAPDPLQLGELLREVLARPYTDGEREECVEIAAKYRLEAIAPLIQLAIEEASE
jgi:glycosyltransferase involved in cell wall biosynthesis